MEAQAEEVGGSGGCGGEGQRRRDHGSRLELQLAMGSEGRSS